MRAAHCKLVGGAVVGGEAHLEECTVVGGVEVLTAARASLTRCRVPAVSA